MFCEVQILEFWTEVRIQVIAPQTEARDPHCLALGTPTLTMRTCRQRFRIRLLRHRLGDVLSLRCFVLAGASPKLNWAFGVVMAFHQETADALAFLAVAIPIVALNGAVVTMTHVFP